MATATIPLEEWDTLPEKKKVCFILCERNQSEDCKNDMGIICQLYQKVFEDLFEEFDMEDDLHAWDGVEDVYDDEDEIEDEDEDEDCDCDDGDCDLIIDLEKDTSHRNNR